MTSANRLRDMFSQRASIYARPLARRIVLGLAFFLLFMLILSAEFLPDKVSLQVGQVSDRDVLSPRTVSYVDAARTKQLEVEVLASVPNVYDLDVSVMTKAEENIGLIFRAARVVLGDKSLTTLEMRRDKWLNTVSLPLGGAAIDGILSLSETELAATEDVTRTIVRKYLQRGIREDDLEGTVKQIVLETEKKELGFSAEAVVIGVSQSLLRPNFLLNIRETDKRKQSALASVESVRVTVKQGQVLVRKGDIVTAEQMQAMEELGLHAGQVSHLRIFGLAIFVVIVMALSMGYLYKFVRPVYENDLQLLLFGLIVLVTLLIGKAAHYYSDFAAPLAAGAMLTAILINPPVGMLSGVVVALFFGVIAEGEMRAAFVPLVGSMVGVYCLSRSTHGYSLTRAGVLVAAANFLVICALGFVEQEKTSQLLFQGLLGLLSGISAAVITTGFLPYLEHAFHITSPIKLLDLAKPDHPLLQRLLLDAPGTYHHSVLVGNMAETAAAAIGADPVAVRVGSYYHDIGKIKRPYFFIENQVGSENPHDKIAPSLSTLIVTSHIRDGVDLCRDYKLPQIIIDIVEQHHGTTLATYFYRRATENEHSDCIIEADFRYEGPRPQTREAALVMLADACEASVRSLSKPNVNRIEGTVRKMIRERLHDGQLDECTLTLKDLNTVGDVFIRVLSSMFHTRIEYPETLKELERKKGKYGNNHKPGGGRDEPAGNGGRDGTVGAAKSG